MSRVVACTQRTLPDNTVLWIILVLLALARVYVAYGRFVVKPLGQVMA
jgi:hypothetical protein